MSTFMLNLPMAPRLTSLYLGAVAFKYFNSYNPLQVLKHDVPLTHFKLPLKFYNMSLNKCIFCYLEGEN